MNKPNSPSGSQAQERKPEAAGNQQTPEADMQPEDAGTPASGAADRGSPAAPAIKQFPRTRPEHSGRP